MSMNALTGTWSELFQRIGLSLVSASKQNARHYSDFSGKKEDISL